MVPHNASRLASMLAGPGDPGEVTVKVGRLSGGFSDDDLTVYCIRNMLSLNNLNQHMSSVLLC
jgi:hypothetical protein